MKKIKNLIKLLILFLGASGALALVSNQLSLLSKLQGLGTVPIPLVFDAPQGYEFWANTNTYEIITNYEKFSNLTFDQKTYQNFPTHSIVHNTILIPITMFPVLNENDSRRFLKKVFCSSDSWHNFLPRKVKSSEKVIFFKLKIYSKKSSWEMEVACT